MLTIVLEEQEFFDEEEEKFIELKAVEVQLEHSLVSLSKWESKYEKPFLDKEEKTDGEVFDYFRAMISSGVVPDNFIERLSAEQFEDLSKYIDSKMTATWFADGKSPPTRETITSELIYYWMISLNVPMDCQHWHLNRLLTLIKVCSIKNQPPKKVNRIEQAQKNRELNAQRRAQLDTSG